ncbi:MAG: large subunit ribosomal protein [Gemmatimonadales bacterium]|jgi:large subunit ribosomal protein L15|nr:large subunit ribosomal protein [Gemmatimonadales bacterium]
MAEKKRATGGAAGQRGSAAAKRATSRRRSSTAAAPEQRQLTLSTLSPAPGSTQARKRVGRGPGSGLGKTSGKGNKGHKARTGGGTNPGFEGGQMPLYRRLPKRGFTNPFRVETQVVNLADLKKLSAGDISPETLYSAGLIAKADSKVKLLGTGEADRSYTVRGVAISASARAKIEAAGGKIEG